jgi:hypothetical protein
LQPEDKNPPSKSLGLLALHLTFIHNPYIV